MTNSLSIWKGETHWLAKGLGSLGSHRIETLGRIHRAPVLNKHGGSGVEQEGLTRLLPSLVLRELPTSPA